MKYMRTIPWSREVSGERGDDLEIEKYWELERETRKWRMSGELCWKLYRDEVGQILKINPLDLAISG